MRSKSRAALAATLFCVSIAAIASSPAPIKSFAPQFAPLSNVSNMLIGKSVALSSDGLLAAIAFPGADASPPTMTNVGEVDIYAYGTLGGIWGESSFLIDPNAANNSAFGTAIAIAANDTAILVGAPGDNKAYLFTLSGGNWLLSQTFLDPYTSSGFGTTVALSADGSVAVVGDHTHGVGSVSNVGAAFVYRLSGGVWSTATEVDDPFTPTSTDDFGYAVALSSDGSRLLVGAPQSDVSGLGNAYLFTASGSAWTLAQTFSDPGHTAADEIGTAVAISGDGNTVLCGSPDAHGALGAVYLFKDDGASWSSAQEFDDPDTSGGADFGAALSVSADGSIWSASAPGSLVNRASQAGKVYIYQLTGGAWQTPVELDDPGATQGDLFGSLALSGDGSTLLVGAPGTPSGGYTSVGNAYMYNPGVELDLLPSVFSASAVSGGAIEYNVEVDDKSASVSAGTLTVTITLPAGLSYKGSDQNACSATGSTVSCSLAPVGIEPGGRTAINVDTAIASTASGTLKTQFSVRSDSQYALGSSTTSASVSTQVTGSSGSGGSSSGGGKGAVGWLSLLMLLGVAITKRGRR